MTAPTPATQSRFNLYGKLAFAAVVLVVFSEFLRLDRVRGEPWQIVLTFTLGGVYATLGVIGFSACARRGAPSFAAYMLTQCTLATALVLFTPLKGFSFLITMPIASEAVLDLNWRWATLVIVELFAACVAAIWITYGLQAGLQVISSYGIAFVFTVVFSLVTRRALEARHHAEQLSNELATANEQLRLYAEQAGELATTRERNRLAREIHDGLGHYLTTINVQLEAAHAVIATNPTQAAGAVETAARLSREALDDVRRSVGTLRTDVARPPLPEALEALARNLGLDLTVQLQGQPRPLPPAVEHALYRSAQEGLTNVRKHAGATHTNLTLDFLSPSHVALTVADNGRGLADAATSGSALSSGYGLRGVRERLELLGGKVTTANRPGGGFILSLEVPA